MQSQSRQHRCQQCVFILAIAVLVFEHLASMVRLIPSYAKGNPDIADLRRNISIHRLNLFFFCSLARS